MFCPKCGREVSGNSTFCPVCAIELREVGVARKTVWSKVAGILEIVSGGFGLVGVFIMTIAMIVLANDPYRHEPDDVDPIVILVAVSIPLAILSLLAIVGGIFALRRKNWGLVLTGAIATTLPFPLMGIAALILTALSKDEFT